MDFLSREGCDGARSAPEHSEGRGRKTEVVFRHPCLRRHSHHPWWSPEVARPERSEGHAREIIAYQLVIRFPLCALGDLAREKSFFPPT